MDYVRDNLNKIIIDHDMICGISFNNKDLWLRKVDLIDMICALDYDRLKFIFNALIIMESHDDLIKRYMRRLAHCISSEMIYNRKLRGNCNFYKKIENSEEFELLTIDEMV